MFCHYNFRAFYLHAEETAALQAARRADKLSSKMKRSLQARADKLDSLGCSVALMHLSRKGTVSHINSASVTEALQGCSAEQQLAMQQEMQKGPDQLIQLLKASSAVALPCDGDCKCTLCAVLIVPTKSVLLAHALVPLLLDPVLSLLVIIANA